MYGTKTEKFPTFSNQIRLRRAVPVKRPHTQSLRVTAPRLDLVSCGLRAYGGRPYADFDEIRVLHRNVRALVAS